jgi:SAM-dependent methyltransferase
MSESQSKQDKATYNSLWARQPPGARPPHGDMAELFGLIKEHPNATLVDLGCETGRNVLPAARQGIQVVAIDHNSVAVRQLRDLAAEQRLPIRVQQADFVSWLADRPADADAVVCINALHHVSSDREVIADALRAMVGIVRTDGYLLVALLTNIRYGDFMPPPGRLLISEQEGLDLLTTSLRHLELVWNKREYGRNEGAIMFDSRTDSLRPGTYEAVQVSALFHRIASVAE